VRAASTPIGADGLRHTATWDQPVDNEDDTLEPLQGREFHFRFYLENADLSTMSFW